MPQTIIVSQLMEMLESIGLQDEWQWRWNKLRELIDAAEQKRALDDASFPFANWARKCGYVNDGEWLICHVCKTPRR